MEKKVLIIGLDGARPDAVRAADTPNIDTLVRRGVVSWNAETEPLTSSGPAWTSLLTGVHTEKHDVRANDAIVDEKSCETFFRILKNRDPAIRCVAHSNWAPIITEIFEAGALDVSSSGGPDREITRHLVADIADGAGDLYFVQLDEVDGAGHDYGYSPRSQGYLRKIEEADHRIGEILDAVDARPRWEDWLLCLVSDHGGIGTGHGGSTPEEQTILFIVAGAAIARKGEIPVSVCGPPQIVDVVPTIAEFLGAQAEGHWDGRSHLGRSLGAP